MQPYSPVGILALLAELTFAAKKQYDLLSGRLSNKIMLKRLIHSLLVP